MSKKFNLFLLLLVFFSNLSAQEMRRDLRNRLIEADKDSTRVLVLEDVVGFYREKNRDSAIHYIKKAIAICDKNNQVLKSLWFKHFLANQYLGQQKFSSGYQLLNDINSGVQNIESKNAKWLIRTNMSLEQNKYLVLTYLNYNFQILMSQTSNTDEVRKHIILTRQYASQIAGKESLRFLSGSNTALAYLLISLQKPDSAIIVLKLANQQSEINEYFKTFNYMLLGLAYSDLRDYKNANYFLHLAIRDGDSKNIATRSALRLSQNLLESRQFDSAYYYAKFLVDTLTSFGFSNYEVDIGVAYKNMYECFSAMNLKDSVFKYAILAIKAQDSLQALRVKNLTEFQQLLLSENKRIEALDDERNAKVSRLTNLGAISFAILIGIISILLFRNVRQSKLANINLIEQKDKLQQTLHQLQSTQSQLIQSEKMASLGELTAGIAHEIQNPLNFVNNFSEVSTELVKEMVQEVDRGNTDEVKAIANDVVQNLEKINHHGQRASDIVKGMLQHSRSSSGVKELTDINALCDEYLRLSYHGLRAKDKSFNAEFETKFDAALAPINVVPQDIGRVILNLINNAFYAVNERQKNEKDSGYKPRVTLTTKKQADQVVIEVADNGTGMPEQVKEKIFQPFFTTKPTGEGTGLGLSLSYDIVTKGHGGELRVETKEGIGSEFIIQFPIV
jgi:signal transduction histidine kinase